MDASPAGNVPSKDLTPTLTLTALYNVMEALREGRNLTAKEKAINEQGLVSVLKALHDELDAAVLAAYGWADLATTQRQPHDGQSTDGLLGRLLALNAKRAAEEKTGQIRWLRPDFQNRAAGQSARELLLNNELLMHTAQGLQANLALETPEKPRKSAKTRPNPQNEGDGEGASQATHPWPATLPGQVRAVAELLAAAAAVMPLPLLHPHPIPHRKM